jgi:hypothetical protein
LFGFQQRLAGPAVAFDQQQCIGRPPPLENGSGGSGNPSGPMRSWVGAAPPPFLRKRRGKRFRATD